MRGVEGGGRMIRMMVHCYCHRNLAMHVCAPHDHAEFNFTDMRPGLGLHLICRRVGWIFHPESAVHRDKNIVLLFSVKETVRTAFALRVPVLWHAG